jgi:hypothetical protein
MMNEWGRIIVVAIAIWLVASFALYWSGLGLERYSDWAATWSRAVPFHDVVPLYDSSCLEQPAVTRGELYFGCRTAFSVLGYSVFALVPTVILAILVAAASWVRSGFRSA